MSRIRPRRSASLIVAAAVAASAAPASAQAVDPTAQVDRIFAWATPASPGCAVAVSQHGKVVVNRAYGSADLERDVPLTTDTVFDAGSVTKQFVAAVVLLLAADGRVALTDDIRTYVPELADFGRTVTIDHLLTHTSGVRDWTGILPFSAASRDALSITLRQRGLNFVPGDEWAYSNSGYVLLKELVARVTKTSFDDAAATRLFRPLGMTSTRYLTDLREVVARRALAYERAGGRWRMDVLLDEARGGGGGLLTTTGDLLIWNQALTDGRLGAFVTAKLHEPARLNNGRTLGYARGLFLDENDRVGRIAWHSGSAGGYKALAGRYRDHGLSIAILCNAGDDADRMDYARRIADIFVPGARARSAEAAPADQVAVPEQELAAKAGVFVADRPGAPLRLIVEQGRLRVVGGPALVALSAERFRRQGDGLDFLSGDPFELRFASRDELALRLSDGSTTRYRRATPAAPTLAALQALEGRYESDEMGTVFEVAAREGGLLVRLAHAPARALEFRPVDRDTFQRGMMIVRFRRDAAGAPVGFAYSNPLVRDVPFTRQPVRVTASAQ